MDSLIYRAYNEPLPTNLERWVANEPYRRFLYYLILERKPQAVVELGVYLGETSAVMAAACQQVGATCIGVDCGGHNSNIAEVESAYPCYKFLFCDTLGAAEVAPKLLGSRRIGILFQDSSHHAETSWQEFLYWKPLMAQSSVWVCDDITPSFKMPDEPRGMEGYFERLPGRKRLFPGLHLGNTIGVVEWT